MRQSEGEASETVVTLGKQLSQRWYVGYERGLNATTGTWQLIYRIAQRFTLRAQSGERQLARPDLDLALELKRPIPKRLRRAPRGAPPAARQSRIRGGRSGHGACARAVHMQGCVPELQPSRRSSMDRTGAS